MKNAIDRQDEYKQQKYSVEDDFFVFFIKTSPFCKL